MLQHKKRRSNEEQPVRARKQQRAGARLSRAPAGLSPQGDDADSEDDMPLGALIAQRRPAAAVPAEATSQPTALAAATSVLPVAAVQQGFDVAEDHDKQAEGTPAPDAASSVDPSAPHPDAGPAAAHGDGTPGPAQGLASAPASPVDRAGHKGTLPSLDDGTTPERGPDSAAALLAKAADQPAAAAAALRPAAKATVDTAVDYPALQPAATAMAATVGSHEAGAACAAEHVEQQQPPQGSADAMLSAAGVPLVTAPVAIATYSSVVRLAGAVRSLDSQLPPDASIAAVPPEDVHSDLLSIVVNPEVRGGSDTELLAVRQPEAASPAEDGAAAEAPNASLACAPEPAATPLAASPALLITTQDWHRLLGAGETDDAAGSPGVAGRAADVTLSPALDDPVGNFQVLLSPGAVRPIVTSQDVVPDSDTSHL